MPKSNVICRQVKLSHDMRKQAYAFVLTTNFKPYKSTLFITTLFVLRNEFNFWNVHGNMNTSGLVQSK